MRKVLKICLGLFLGVGALCLGLFIKIGDLPINEAKTANGKEDSLVITESVAKPVEVPAPKVDSDKVNPTKSEGKSIGAPVQKEKIIRKEVILDVPLLMQMDAPRLYNGCEVTSLAMVLNYNGKQVTKNELAANIPRVPLKYKDGKNGNPNFGFVGDMENGPGLGVYHDPIFRLAQSYVNNRAENLTKQPFSSVIKKLSEGNPVWVITTTTFSPTSEMKTWQTPQGSVEVTYKMHSVVITGYDQEHIYINDPYGGKNKKVNKENFIKAWEQMGSQAVVVNNLKTLNKHELPAPN